MHVYPLINIPNQKIFHLPLQNLPLASWEIVSTTRSDLRAWEETFGCPASEFDHANLFQKKNEDGTHVCGMAEQSVNLTKCGIPSLKDIPKCPAENSPSFRYFYKVYPWTSLDRYCHLQSQNPQYLLKQFMSTISMAGAQQDGDVTTTFASASASASTSTNDDNNHDDGSKRHGQAILLYVAQSFRQHAKLYCQQADQLERIACHINEPSKWTTTSDPSSD